MIAESGFWPLGRLKLPSWLRAAGGVLWPRSEPLHPSPLVMRVRPYLRLRYPAVSVVVAVITSVAVHAPAPVGPALDEAASSVETADDHVTALEERLASLRMTTSRSQAQATTRLWPAAGAHTGWWGEPRGGRAHAGIDIDGDTGDRIEAAAKGTVLHAGPAPAGYGGYGLMVVIEHGEFATLYAHLSRVDVAVGHLVDASDPIGLMGTTGNVTGSHLHFEVRVAGVAVDPAPYFPAASR